MITLALLALACTVKPSEKPDVDTADVNDVGSDVDRDGYTAAEGDCDDSDGERFPGAGEVCDGLDQDCDGQVDEGVGATFYEDGDQDGYGNPDEPIQACEQPQDAVATATDCDDADGGVFPGAPEVCDGVDNDCDGTADDGVDVAYFPDLDGDGYGDDAGLARACELPADGALEGGDCDDALADVYPSASEVCDGIDQDCDGQVDEELTETFWADVDGDGWGDDTIATEACSAPDGYAARAEDCDDGLADVYPGAPEVCDGVDNDCDGTADGSGSVDAVTWHIDYDGDGFGGTRYTVVSCDAPPGYVEDASDCDDGTATTYPGAAESCDGIDNDCNGAVDDGGSVSWYADADGDGFGDPDSADTGCDVPAGAALEAGDCDDASSDVYPGAVEACDGADNDCDGDVDEDVTTAFWADLDGDGWGDPSLEIADCAAPSGYVSRAEDCDDGAPTTNPSAAELCDGTDNDCDGTVDEAGAADARDWYADADGDGYGRSSAATTSCSAPSGTSSVSGDCDDARAITYPGAPEICDDLDNDCDGSVDDSAVDAPTWYIDYDADGYGGSRYSATQCDAPSGYVADASDCDDASASHYPGATEYCDGADDDCDGVVDEADAVDAAVWFADVDGDGWGDTTDTSIACDAPAGSVALDGDCAVSDRTAYPGAPEYCDGSDDDCDGSIDEDTVDAGLYYADTDGDGFGGSTTTVESCTAPSGFVTTSTDCADAYASRYPGAPETCNDADDDCDGIIDDGLALTTWYTDADGDGWGRLSGSVVDCVAPSGSVADAGDCDDADADVSPDAAEACNDVDDDCDGSVDEGLSTSTWYIDYDGDGYGTTASATSDCAPPARGVSVGGDCNDGLASVSPAATETCNGIDDDCDGTIDDGVLGSGSACPAEDCAEIIAANPSAGSGNYVLDIGTYYCDMSTDGGGWTRVANNLPVYGTGYDGTYYNGEGFAWDEALFRYDSGSVTAHCTYPGSLTGCNNLGFQFASESWGVPLNWGSSICGMSITDYTSATTYVGGYDFKVARSTSTATIRLGTLEGISYCTPGDNPGTAYVDVYVRR